MAHKDEIIIFFTKFWKNFQNKKWYSITSIKTNPREESDCKPFEVFCNEYSFNHKFSIPRTPQQKWIIKIKNKILQEMRRTILCKNSLPKYFWAEAVNTSCYVQIEFYLESF